MADGFRALAARDRGAITAVAQNQAARSCERLVPRRL